MHQGLDRRVLEVSNDILGFLLAEGAIVYTYTFWRYEFRFTEEISPSSSSLCIFYFIKYVFCRTVIVFHTLGQHGNGLVLTWC